MKKFFVLLLLSGLVFSPAVLAKQSVADIQIKEAKKNVQYTPIPKHERDYAETGEYSFKPSSFVYDPKLISLSSYTPVSDADFNKKQEKDEQFFVSKMKPYFNKRKTAKEENNGVDYYNAYRVTERLIRANNLDFVNWRIAIRKTKDVNASSYAGYYITINTGLYDALYTNEDALAFVFAHEMTHQLMGHNQRLKDLSITANRLQSSINSASRASAKNGESLVAIVAVKRLKNIYRENRMMELVADAGALELLLRAGYSPYRAQEALNYLDSLSSEKRYFTATHPVGEDRIINYKDSLIFADPNWVNVGRENLYKYEPLQSKKSSDRVSFIINKSDKTKDFYHVETPQEKMQRIAYVSYLQDYMGTAVKYFRMLSENEDSYIPYVYLSYTLERLAQKTGKDKQKGAIRNIQKAYEMAPNDSEVIKRYTELGLDKRK
jgi:predicted Zn-dependent protease